LANVAHFTDTFYEINGVALTLQQQVRMALKNNKKLTVITCHAENHRDERSGVKNFNPTGVYELPEYPEQKIYYPPFLEMLNYCYEQNFTRIQSATPGPIGLAALGIARILKLPISGTYHTALPQYAQYLTGDEFIEELTWKYTLWYYDQMDYIYVPSQSSKDELIQKGIQPDKIRLFPRGINAERFHPSKRNGILENCYHIRDRVTKLLYVGRVSKEKNLPLLSEAFKTVAQNDRNLHLVVVGDGPYLKEMQETMNGLPATFTGYLEGEELAALYASCDIFVFPSTTDTFGNVVLEAQASGIPVIVTDEGGPQENIIPGKTGIVVKGSDLESLIRAVQSLTGNPKLVRTMGNAARRYMEERSFENAFMQSWDLFNNLPTEPEQLAKAG
jgi:glycosyltransferase involved in cell wall biosynthesis